MIDIENEVYTKLKQAIVAELPLADVTGDYVDEPAVFPHVNIMQFLGNARTQVSGGKTLSREVTFEVNIYSNLATGRKAQCKKIAQIVTNTLEEIGFTLVSLDAIPNYFNTAIFRMVGRYRATVDMNKITYRR